MKSHAHTLFLRRYLFCAAAFFAAGSLKSETVTLKVDNNTGADFSGFFVVLDIDAHDITTPVPVFFPRNSHTDLPVIYTVAEETDEPFSGQIFIEANTGHVQGNSFVATTDEEPERIDLWGGPYHGDFIFEIASFDIPQLTPDARKTLWKMDSESLSGDVFREGIDKVVSAFTPSGAAGGTGMTKAEFDTTATELVHQQEKEIFAGYTDEGWAGGVGIGAASSGASAGTAVRALLPNAPTSLGYTPDVSGNADFLHISLPATFGGAFSGSTVDFNPFRSDRMGPLASWFRFATEWLVLGLLGYFVFLETKTYIVGASAARQSAGNPVAGGTGAQATSFVAAGLITAIFVSLVTALASFVFGGIGIGNLVSNLGVNPFNGIPANILWFLNQFLPLTTIVTAFVARIAFPLYGTGFFAVFVSVLRFINP